MTCQILFVDTGTNEYVNFKNIENSLIVPDGVFLAVEEGSLNMDTPSKRQTWSGESPFRNGEDLISSTYNNRTISFTFSIMDEDAQNVVDSIEALNQLLEKARQYALWPVRRGIEMQLAYVDANDYVVFDVLDGHINPPATVFDTSNFQLFGSKYVLHGVTMTLTCKPLARGVYQQLVDGRGDVDEVPHIFNVDPSFTWVKVDDGGVFEISNYAHSDYSFLWPQNGEVGGGTGPAEDDAIYYGMALTKFAGINFTIGQVAVYTGVSFVWEYWNGAWVTLSTLTDTTNGWKTAGRTAITFTAPLDWYTTAVDSKTGYWVRCRISAAVTDWTTNPRQEEDVPHWERDNKVYIDGSSIEGDAPSPPTIVLKNISAPSNEPSTMVKMSGLSRYSFSRIRGIYEAEADGVRQGPSGWAGSNPTIITNDGNASGDYCVEWEPRDNDEQIVAIWDMSTSTGMARDKWGNYVFSVRYKDYGPAAGTLRFRFKCYVYSNSDGSNIYGEESKQFTVPAPYSGGTPRWNTVDIATFPVPPATVSLQTGFKVTFALYAQRTTGDASFRIDYAYVLPADQSYMNARTTFDEWYAGSDTEYVIMDSEASAIHICDSNVVAEDPDTTGAAVAIAGFDNYQAGRFPMLVPGHDFCMALYTKRHTSNRGDNIGDNFEVDVWYAPRFLTVNE